MMIFIKMYGIFISCLLTVSEFSSIIPVGGELSASIEPILSPVILKMWASHVSDPFISIDLIEVLEVILAKHTRAHIYLLISVFLYFLVYMEF